MKKHRIFDWLRIVAACAVFGLVVAENRWWQSALHFLFPSQAMVLYPRVPLIVLVGQHLELVLISSLLTLAVGLPLGIWVTRPSGRDFMPLVSGVTSFGQTFPPVAVLALAVPVLGFGLWPTVIALFLYGLLPVVRNTVAGLRAVPENLVDVSYGMGMSRRQTLFRAELPLAAPVIMAGIRVSVIINVGTAMIGAVVSSGGLGAPIVSGLVQNNIAFVLEGAIPAAGLAILLDQLLANVQNIFELHNSKLSKQEG
jgi:osmoprotectant transport system permease protein